MAVDAFGVELHEQDQVVFGVGESNTLRIGIVTQIYDNTRVKVAHGNGTVGLKNSSKLCVLNNEVSLMYLIRHGI